MLKTVPCAGTDLYCIGSAGQVSVGHAELAAMDVFEDGHNVAQAAFRLEVAAGRGVVAAGV